MRHLLILLVFPLTLTACYFEDATDEATPKAQETPAAAPATSRPDISVPRSRAPEYDIAKLESLRLDPSWREYAELDRRGRASTAPYGQPGATGQPAATEPSPAPAGAPVRAIEKFEQITPDTLQGQPALPLAQEGGGPTTLRVQVLLDRARFSPGVIDGRWGKNTAKAVYWYQFAQGLPPTGEVNAATWQALTQAGGGQPAVRQIRVTEADLRGPFVDIPEDVYQQEKLECLCYESPLEMYAERTHAAPELLEQLNPDVDFARLEAGATLWAPAVPDTLASRGEGTRAPEPTPAPPPGAPAGTAAASAPSLQVARIVVSKKGFYVQALDAGGAILYHFPSTLGSGYDPSPDGQYGVTGIHFDPPFHYQPTLFHEVPDTEPEAQLPAGPNSPVGLVWMALSKPHYGVHGTSEPETIGYASSHGCIRLTNWDAVFLARQIEAGVPVAFRQ